MPVIPESEWQKKFNKTSSQDNSETWQNKFKKPAWQQDTRTWNEKFNHSTTYPTGFVYKPINESYYIKQGAGIPVEGIGLLGGHYFFEGSIVLKEDGSLSVFAKAMTPASSYETTTVWEMTAEIIVNGEMISKKDFKRSKEPYLEPDNNYVKLGNVDFKLPFPRKSDKVILILRGGYSLIVPDLGNAWVTPTPSKTDKKFPLEIMKKDTSGSKKGFGQLNFTKF